MSNKRFIGHRVSIHPSTNSLESLTTYYPIQNQLNKEVSLALEALNEICYLHSRRHEMGEQALLESLESWSTKFGLSDKFTLDKFESAASKIYEMLKKFLSFIADIFKKLGRWLSDQYNELRSKRKQFASKYQALMVYLAEQGTGSLIKTELDVYASTYLFMPDTTTLDPNGALESWIKMLTIANGENVLINNLKYLNFVYGKDTFKDVLNGDKFPAKNVEYFLPTEDIEKQSFDASTKITVFRLKKLHGGVQMNISYVDKADFDMENKTEYRKYIETVGKVRTVFTKDTPPKEGTFEIAMDILALERMKQQMDVLDSKLDQIGVKVKQVENLLEEMNSNRNYISHELKDDKSDNKSSFMSELYALTLSLIASQKEIVTISILGASGVRTSIYELVFSLYDSMLEQAK